MSDPADALTEMLVRAVTGAPAHLLADAVEKFQRILENERRRARAELIRLVWQEDTALAQRLEGKLG
jgi:hypothetical protein